MLCLQQGQVDFVTNHSSMHSALKQCSHPGRRMHQLSGSNSIKQMEQVLLTPGLLLWISWKGRLLFRIISNCYLSMLALADNRVQVMRRQICRNRQPMRMRITPMQQLALRSSRVRIRQQQISLTYSHDVSERLKAQKMMPRMKKQKVMKLPSVSNDDFSKQHRQQIMRLSTPTTSTPTAVRLIRLWPIWLNRQLRMTPTNNTIASAHCSILRMPGRSIKYCNSINIIHLHPSLSVLLSDSTQLFRKSLSQMLPSHLFREHRSPKQQNHQVCTDRENRSQPRGRPTAPQQRYNSQTWDQYAQMFQDKQQHKNNHQHMLSPYSRNQPHNPIQQHKRRIISGGKNKLAIPVSPSQRPLKQKLFIRRATNESEEEDPFSSSQETQRRRRKPLDKVDRLDNHRMNDQWEQQDYIPSYGSSPYWPPSSIEESLYELEQTFTEENCNLREHNKYLLGVIRKMQERDKKHSKQLKMQKNKVQELTARLQQLEEYIIAETFDQRKQTTDGKKVSTQDIGYQMASVRPLRYPSTNSHKLPEFEISQIKRFSEPLLSSNPNMIEGLQLVESHTNNKVLPLSLIQEESRQPVPPTIEQLNEQFENNMRLYKQMHDGQARKKCVELAKKIKALRSKKRISSSHGVS